jgi:hypothetical protein
MFKKIFYQNLGKLIILPFVILVTSFFIFSCSSGKKNTSPQTTEIAQDTAKSLEEIFSQANVDVDASYPGGARMWKNYLMNNLRSTVPVEHKVPSGTYTVIVQFIVYKNGTVRNIKPNTHHGYGMEDEAVRVIRFSGRWIPAMKNGEKVNSLRLQPITFQISRN